MNARAGYVHVNEVANIKREHPHNSHIAVCADPRGGHKVSVSTVSPVRALDTWRVCVTAAISQAVVGGAVAIEGSRVGPRGQWDGGTRLNH